MINTRLLGQETLYQLEQLITIILELAVTIPLLHTGSILQEERGFRIPKPEKYGQSATAFYSNSIL